MQASETTSFEQWYRAAYPGMAESVMRVVGNRDLANEATDEAFARAFAQWIHVRTMQSPSGWTYRVAVNAARRQLRRSATEARLLLLEPPSPPTPPPGGESWSLVAELPVRQRTAVVLRYVVGLTEARIAEAMGVTRSTVSSALASAHQSLGRLLAAPSEEEPIPMTTQLALARACNEHGCQIELLDSGKTGNARWSDAVRNQIKVRPGDLVAVDDGEVVWRWWHGTVVSVDEDSAVVERNVTQRSAGDPRTGLCETKLPPELVGEVKPDDVVYWSKEEDDHVVVVVADLAAQWTKPTG
jgi:RNA polymerase sigma-70 factor (ECF subfamily)